MTENRLKILNHKLILRQEAKENFEDTVAWWMNWI